MQLHDVRKAERARFLSFSAKNCCVFGAENFKNRCRRRGKWIANSFCGILKAAHDGMKTRAVYKCEFVGCGTPNARSWRIFRGKLQRFWRQKIAKSMPKMRKIIYGQVCANFEKQKTIKDCANAIARRAQRRTHAILKIFGEKLPRFRRKKI